MYYPLVSLPPPLWKGMIFPDQLDAQYFTNMIVIWPRNVTPDVLKELKPLNCEESKFGTRWEFSEKDAATIKERATKEDSDLADGATNKENVDIRNKYHAKLRAMARFSKMGEDFMEHGIEPDNSVLEEIKQSLIEVNS